MDTPPSLDVVVYKGPMPSSDANSPVSSQHGQRGQHGQEGHQRQQQLGAFPRPQVTNEANATPGGRFIPNVSPAPVNVSIWHPPPPLNHTFLSPLRLSLDLDQLGSLTEPSIFFPAQLQPNTNPLLFQTAPPAATLPHPLFYSSLPPIESIPTWPLRTPFRQSISSPWANSAMVSPFLPPAPTPPVNNSNSQGMASNRDRNAGLLNLLKFSGQGPQPIHTEDEHHHESHGPSGHQLPIGGPSSYNVPHHVGPQSHHSHQSHQSHPSQQSPHNDVVNLSSSRQPPILAPAPSNADPSGLLAALMRGMRGVDEHDEDHPQDHQSPVAPPSHAAATQPGFGHASPPANTRAYLLDLLSQPKPIQNDQQYLPESHSANLTPQSSDLASLPATMQAAPGSGPRNYGPMPNIPQGTLEYEHRPQDQRGAPGYNPFPMASNGHEPRGPIPVQFPHNNVDSGMTSWSYHSQPSDHGSRGSFSQSQGDSFANSAPFQILKKPKPSDSPKSFQEPIDSHRQSLGHSPSLSPGDTRRKTDLTQAAVDDEKDFLERSLGLSDRLGASSPDKSPVDDAATNAAPEPTPANFESSEVLGQSDANATAETAEGDLPDLDVDDDKSPEGNFHDPKDSAASSPKEEALPDESSDAQEQDTAQAHPDSQAVADSWDSADAEDAGLVEDDSYTPVKVFDFPMQPWISITMTDGGIEARPEFRDGTIMDIARLKKEFDQIDRNLYTASQHCMAYGMSKAGGMHVIRQDDGKDVKVFSNTKDRIFNISMSVTPSEHTGIHREAIMGTGVSGTVYWVQILEGDKDHIEDAHPEQYGFALPPLSSQEGDTSGGVLKTRARVSSCHPEFFAVGRGKSITIVWPYFVMQNNLFRPGHDRVVDAEKLAKQCSLKINTGKAGKDFTFSQDDSVIVSLDKSGRVKFWDVRELTAAKEDGDPNRPLPAHSSLEIKEPLMTLASTPEGEKAWPTSVLLLDKIKPYQKRCALRYMIVGMKQNHTLQLWDLALGKPVQEFNLPHSKESDAVCSVTYNPATGMIVIGHPTRNSIYLAHLSAPKYTFKNISQADYITRLGTKDPTIPTPESTAVISGVREYSFANRGVLRSLDMLSTPAMAQDGDEPTLFELYAMHSRGVACVLVRQRELGWSKDNKVIDGVEALKAGVVTVSPLKALAPQPPEEPAQSKQQGRANREASQHASNQDESVRKLPDSASPVKIQTRKDAENAANAASPAVTLDKVEKRGGRKKKNAAAQAATDSPANGAGASPAVKGNAVSAKGSDSSRGSAASQKAVGPSVSQEAIDATVKNMETRLNASISNVVDTAIRGLNNSILAREADFDSRQLKLLDVISDVLNQNVQNVLGDIISNQFSGSVIPSIADATSKAAAEQVSIKAMHTIQKELGKALPALGEKIVMNESLVDALSEKISARVSSKVENEVMRGLSNSLMPAINNLTIQTTHRVAAEIQQQYQEEIDRLDSQRRADANKVDQLLSLVTRLTDTVSTMAAAQSQFQGEFLKFQQQAIADREQHARAGPGPVVGRLSAAESPGYNAPHHGPPAPPHQQQHQVAHHQHQHQHHQQRQGSHQLSQGSREGSSDQTGRPPSNLEIELGHHISSIAQSVSEGRLEEAIIRWLQSGHEDEIFTRYWSKMSPVHLRDLSPLVQLSVATTVSQHLDTALARQKAAWLEMSILCLMNNVPSFVRYYSPRLSLLFCFPLGDHHTNA